jgi:hypothetical protein
MQARSKRTEITADRVVVELAKIAFANVLDYWPRPGEGIHLHWPDRTAAVQELTVVEAVECCIAEPASRCMRGGGVDEPGAASRDVRRSPRRRGQLRAPGHKDDSAEPGGVRGAASRERSQVSAGIRGVGNQSEPGRLRLAPSRSQ